MGMLLVMRLRKRFCQSRWSIDIGRHCFTDAARCSMNKFFAAYTKIVPRWPWAMVLSFMPYSSRSENMDRVYTLSESHQYHAIITSLAMSDNREPRCNNLSIVYSFNTGEKWKYGKGKHAFLESVARKSGVCYNFAASGATLLKKASLRL